jgi:hypothetical protein
LESLLGEIPVHIIDFLKAHSSNGRECGEDEIEIDIDVLSDDTLLTLRKLLDDFLQDKEKNKENVEMCEIEVHPCYLTLSKKSKVIITFHVIVQLILLCHNEILSYNIYFLTSYNLYFLLQVLNDSGPSNSSLQPFKGTIVSLSLCMCDA